MKYPSDFLLFEPFPFTDMHNILLFEPFPFTNMHWKRIILWFRMLQAQVLSEHEKRDHELSISRLKYSLLPLSILNGCVAFSLKYWLKESFVLTLFLSKPDCNICYVKIFLMDWRWSNYLANVCRSYQQIWPRTPTNLCVFSIFNNKIAKFQNAGHSGGWKQIFFKNSD